MGYRLPAEKQLAFLQNVIHELTVAYCNTNPVRIACITLADRLNKKFEDEIQVARLNHDEKLAVEIEDEAISVLKAALVFMLVSIKEVEYKGREPTVTNYGFFTLGSTFYTKLTSLLLIDESNLLTDYDKLNFIHTLFGYIQQQDDNGLFASNYWRRKQGLLDAIYLTLQKIIDNQQTVINALLIESPDFFVLKENVKKVIQEYNKEVASRTEVNDSRQNFVNLLAFINLHCLEVKHVQEEKIDDLQSYVQYSQCDTLKGALLLPLLSQEAAKCGLGFWRRFQGSSLANLCLEALNIKATTDMTFDAQSDYLKALLRHINWLKRHQKESIEHWEAEYGSLQLDKNIKEITDFYKSTKKQAGQTSFSDTYLRSLASTAAQHGITLTATKVVKDVAIQGLKVALLGAGPVGVVTFTIVEGLNAVILDATTTMLLREVGSYVADNILPSAISRLYAEVLGRIGDTIGGTAIGAVQLSVATGYQGIKNLLGFYKEINPNDKEYIENTEWIITLLKLPDDLFSKENKDKILKSRDLFPALHKNPQAKLVEKPTLSAGL